MMRHFFVHVLHFFDTEFSVSFHVRIIVDSCVIVAVVTSHSAFIPLWHSFLLHMMSVYLSHWFQCRWTDRQTPFEKDVGLKGNEVQFHMCARQQIRLNILIIHPLTLNVFFFRKVTLYLQHGRQEPENLHRFKSTVELSIWYRNRLFRYQITSAKSRDSKRCTRFGRQYIKNDLSNLKSKVGRWHTVTQTKERKDEEWQCLYCWSRRQCNGSVTEWKTTAIYQLVTLRKAKLGSQQLLTVVL